MDNEIEEFEFETEQAEKPDLATTLKALKDNEKGRPGSTVCYGLSGLMREETAQLQDTWQSLPDVYRRRVMRELIEVSENNIEMDYRSIGIFGLNDSDPGVREASIEVLWEDESLEVMNHLVKMAQHDSAINVRAAATIALSRFILMGELGDLPQGETLSAQNAAIKLLQDEREDLEVRRRALEAIANCSHDIVPHAIQEAYQSPHQSMRVSAVFAMGRSCDERWEDFILEEINSTDPEMCYEAARAAGELTLIEAVPRLAELTLEEDREIVEVAIWSLGEIGGKEASRILSLLEEKAEEEEDEELLQAIEEALDNAAFASGDDLFLYEFD